MPIRQTTVNSRGWPGSVSLNNAETELIATAAVVPRVKAKEI